MRESSARTGHRRLAGFLGVLIACLLGGGLVPAAAAAGPVRPDTGGPGTPDLYAGQCLQSGQELDNQSLALVMGNDGNVVMTDDSHAVWANGKTGHPGSRLCMQGDGNLVEYSSSGVAVWSSGTAGNSGAHAQVTGAGGAEVVNSGSRLWGTPLPNTEFQNPTSSTSPDVLWPGQHLGAPGFEMLDRNQKYSLYEYEGWLEEYLNGTQTLLWYSGSYCSGSSETDMQTDGNLVTYCNGSATWSTGTGGHPTSYGIWLHLQTDGNVVLYTNYGTAVWANGE
jgi:hypothetical protein